MLQIDAKTEGLSETTRMLMGLPGIFQRARRSALSSVGWWVSQELRNHIEYGGSGWQKLHPLPLRLRKFRSAPATPLFFLGRFVRYLIDKDATVAEIGLGKSRKGEPGQTDEPWLTGTIRRHEEGARIPVTRKTRLVWLSTKIKGGKWKKQSRSGAVTGGYFVLKPETTRLTIPKRPVFGPVFRKIQGDAVKRFETQFLSAIDRYWTGGAKA